MRFLALFFVLVFSIGQLEAQNDDPDALNGELVVQTFNAQSADITTFRLNPVDFSIYCWDYSAQPYSLNRREVEPNVNYAEVSITGNLICQIPGFRVKDCDLGFDWEYCGTTMVTVENLNLGTYRVEIYVNNVLKTHFYYDTRTSKFPNNNIFSCDPCGDFQNDWTLRYSVSNNKVYLVEEVNIDPINNNWYLVRQGESFNLWELNECESYCVDGFSPRPFAVLYPPTPSGEVSPKPVLNWSAPDFPGETFVKYKVQRSINGGDFVTLAEITNINNRTYTDYEVNWNPDPQNTNFMQYRIATIYLNYGEQLPANSNIQKIFVGKWTQVSKDAARNLIGSEELDFLLNHNYPNPFNPETEISFYINEKGFVNLKVINILGEEIAALVNEIKNKGSCAVKFNARYLPSGIYFYTITVNGFRETKKMILMR